MIGDASEAIMKLSLNFPIANGLPFLAAYKISGSLLTISTMPNAPVTLLSAYDNPSSNDFALLRHNSIKFTKTSVSVSV